MDGKRTQDRAQVVADADTLRLIVREAVGDALIRVGLDTENADATRRDLAYLRQWRVTMETVRTEGLVVATKWVVTGLFVLIVIGFGVKLGVKLPGG